MAEEGKTRKITQYIAAVAVTLGGFGLGTVIGWASPATNYFSKQTSFSETEITWIASIMPLGAATATVVMAFCFDLIGRKWIMLLLAIPFVLGWAVLAFVETPPLYMVGRFITGFSGGAFCIVAPTYTAEIAEKSIRGRLGVFFQLLLVIGILFAYALGEFHNLKALTLPCGVVPIIFALIIFFLPESPVYSLKKKKEEKARKALVFYRGPNYNVDSELKEMSQYATEGGEESFWSVMKRKSTLFGSLMLLGLHCIQQLSGINVVMFYAHKIFEMSGSSLAPGISAIILGVVQVVATAFAAYAVDRFGRKLLLIVSLSVMCLCQVVIGGYFMLDSKDHETARSMGFVPLLSICMYLVGFSLGAGPLPFTLLGELLPNRVKGGMGSFSTFCNWMLALAITSSFPFLVDIVGPAMVFFAYAVLCALGVLFVIFILIETKNKSLEEIQKELGAKDTAPAASTSGGK